MKEEDMEILRGQINSFYDSILKRVMGFTYDSIVASRQQIARESFQEFGKRAASEKKLMLQLLQQTHISSAPMDSLSLNSVFKQLVEKVALWDADFSEFVRLNLQHDSRDLGRAALKRIFVLEKDQSISESTKGNFAPIFTNTLPETPLMHLDKTKLPSLGTSPTSGSFDLKNCFSEFGLERQLSMVWGFKSGNNASFSLPEIGASPILRAIPIAATKITPFLLTTHDSAVVALPDADIPFEDYLEEGIMYPRQIFNRRSTRSSRSHQTSKIITSKTVAGIAANKYEEVEPRPILSDNEDQEGLNRFTGVAAESSDGDRFGPSPLPGERASIMQTISNLWTGNVANFLPLIYPSY
jgi:hypothetical protein